MVAAPVVASNKARSMMLSKRAPIQALPNPSNRPITDRRSSDLSVTIEEKVYG